MKDTSVIIGKEKGRQLAFEGTPGVHVSQWLPQSHPGNNEVPYILYPRSIKFWENIIIRKIWESSDYNGKHFVPFDISDVPSKYRLGQVLACGIKATCATYSQHWQGMYFDWTFNNQCREAFSQFKELKADERFVENAFATVVIMNTGYGGAFDDLLKLRRKPLPPSLSSLEHIDMGTFEHNLKCAVGSALGGNIGVNVIRQSLAKNLITGPNSKGYESIKELVMIEGMNAQAEISSIIQLGFKKSEDRVFFDKETMDMAGAKLVERKSERRNADFTREVSPQVMTKFFLSFNRELRKVGVKDVVKTVVIEGNSKEGNKILRKIRERIDNGVEKARQEVLDAYDVNYAENPTQHSDRNMYNQIADLIAELGKKVLKPREDGHKMVFVAIDMNKLRNRSLSIDVAEHALGEAIQAALNSVHLDGTSNIPQDEDMLYGAFCLTGPIHSAELIDSDEVLARGWGNGFKDIFESMFSSDDKMEAIISVCAKTQQDALIAEKQNIEQRKSVNDIFWYRTWNHPEGKKLDLPHWISYADILHVVPIPGNDMPLQDKETPEYLPSENPITKKFTSSTYVNVKTK
jgi:hypothetical protein